MVAQTTAENTDLGITIIVMCIAAEARAGMMDSVEQGLVIVHLHSERFAAIGLEIRTLALEACSSF